MNLAAQSIGNGRSSVLNPFTSAMTNAKMMKTIDGRRSVMPKTILGNSMIQEMVEDEDTSSFASKNRVSQMMQMVEDVSIR